MFTPFKDQTQLLIAKYDRAYEEDISCSYEDNKLTLVVPVYGSLLKKAKLAISFPAKNGIADIERNIKDWDDYKIKSFGLIKLGPGTWYVEPRVDKDPIHAFVILCNVPTPAPWELQVQDISNVINNFQKTYPIGGIGDITLAIKREDQ